MGVLGEAFIYDEQKFPPQVGLEIAVPWRVVPGDLPFPGFVLSRVVLLVACFSSGANLSLKS